MGAFLKILVSVGAIMGAAVQANPACPEPQPGMTNVHLVCHTHDDVGWLKTVDQYYYGSRKEITWVGVQYILDSVIDSLQKDPSRKFVYVESAFFFRWWEQQNQETKDIVSGLVESGQLEFVGGGWCMNDEAAVHYNAVIDQMSLGLARLNDTFGPTAFPRIAWQLDPFGHSKEQASLFAQMGMDGLFFSRLDHYDKDYRWSTKTMEMVWKASNSLGRDAWLFTGVLPNHYSPPSGFCFDLLCNDDPIMDDPNLEDYNKDEMVERFLDAVRDQQNGFLTSNLIMTMGEDFHYMNAEAWYKNLDKLIRYVNERQVNGSSVNVFYSTPSCYLDSLHAANITWPSKTDDFFPYSSNQHEYWTGYFTSRPTLKGFIRFSNNILQAAKQISALGGQTRGPSVTQLAEAMGIAQHHDAVTGTAKQHVTDDYSKRLSEGVDAATAAFQEGLSYFAKKKKSFGAEKIEPKLEDSVFCPQLNISSCPYTEGKNGFVVNVYNPIARSRSHYVRVPVVVNTQVTGFSVTDELGDQVEMQLVPLPAGVLSIPGRDSSATHELVFFAENLPPLGSEQFLVQPSSDIQDNRDGRTVLSTKNDYAVDNGQIQITLHGVTHKLKTFGKLGREITQNNVTQEWLWYAGYNTGDFYSSDNSGAYLFRPSGDPEVVTDTVSTYTVEGPLVTEMQQQWDDWLTQVIRLYHNTSYVEVQWTVGPIPTQDSIGKEIVTRFTWQDMATNGTFYTDGNGREMQKRVKDYRETWNLVSTEPVSQNYYPVNSRIILSSVNGMGDAVVLNDRSQGGTSLSDGEIELMVHRRLLVDDAKGVGEALDEMAFGTGLVATGKHFFFHSDAATVECDFGCQHRILGEELLLQPILTFSPSSSFTRRSRGTPKAAGLTEELPPNLRILTLEPWSEATNGVWLLRIENFFEEGESALSGETSLDIRDIFSDWEIDDIQELTLGANQFKEDNIRLEWNTDSGKETEFRKERDSPRPSYSFGPMQIRTFLVRTSAK